MYNVVQFPASGRSCVQASLTNDRARGGACNLRGVIDSRVERRVERCDVTEGEAVRALTPPQLRII